MINVEALKRNILLLALEGKLTEQFASDGNSKQLIADSINEKQNILGLKKAKNSEPKDEDQVFPIPYNWNWVRLSDISQIESGGTPSRGEKKYWNGTIPWLKIGDLKSKYITTSSEYITELGLNNSSARIFRRETILYTIFATIGVVGILNIDAATNQAIAGLTFFGKINKDYLYYVLVGLKDVLVGKSHGMTQSNINLTILKSVFIPIPPLEEQKRIVAKLNEIFTELDRIDELQKRLVIIQEKMKAKILQLAIQGKLVEQRPEEGTGEELFKLIQQEKQELIKRGKIKKEKPLLAIEDDEIPFEIPATWKWVRLSEITYNHGQMTPNTRFSYIDIGSIDNINHCLNESENIIEPENAPSRARKIVCDGDIVYSTVRPYLHNIAIIDKEFSEKPIASTGFAILGCLSGVVNKYLFRCLLSSYFDSYANMDGNAKGVMYPAISDDKLSKGLVPLPPLEEQKRIVVKIEELLPLCRGN